MSFSPATIPQISISPAPPLEPVVEPYSPFASIKYSDDDDGFRSRLLTPPPSSSFGHRSTPPSSGSDSDEERFDYNEGLDCNRFEALLQATRERNARKGPDLRREVTLRAHRTKQVERRARFITRVLAGPLTVAANSLAPPCVLPSSPKVVPTFSKPSPLPLHNDHNVDDVEQFDIHEKETPNLAPVTISPAGRGNALPSLEEIRARLMSKQRPEGNQTLPPCAEYMDLKVPQPRLPRLSSTFQPADQTRASRSQDMLCALRRRTLPSNGDEEDKKWKRHSAPGDLFPSQARVGFQHPVLSMPGGF
ncbi:hypothetical protein JOM56_006231 [Amanita muscaria]